jgi:hypothetical protein
MKNPVICEKTLYRTLKVNDVSEKYRSDYSFKNSVNI